MSTVGSTLTNRKSRRVPAELRQRTENSCDRCKTRKHKCRRITGADSDRCCHCEKYGYECIVTKPRKPRLPPAAAAAAAAATATGVLVEAYSARMEAMEELIKGLVPEADVTSLASLHCVGRELGIPLSSDASQNHSPELTNAQDHDASTTNTLHDSMFEPAGSGMRRTPRRTQPLPGTVTSAFYTSPPPSSPAMSSTSSNHSEALVQDRQGQQQYIGQASSYYFQIHLQTLVGGGRSADAGQMQLFGPNPVDKKDVLLQQHGAAASHAMRDATTSPEAVAELAMEDMTDLHPPANRGVRRLSSGRCGAVQPAAAAAVAAGMELLSGPQSTEVLSSVHAFFEHVNTDFPVLHEVSFLETLDFVMKTKTQSSPGTPRRASLDRVWLCTLYCVMILGRLHLSLATPTTHSPTDDDPDELWLWAQIEALLPTVLFTSSLASIQALLLASLHLHNTNSRDVCWTLTGAALRLGYAIGLHRPGLVDNDTTAASTPPRLRAMRKTIWWTLYAFEQLQVSSHDRPSAVVNRHVQPLPPPSTAGYGHTEHASRLTLLLGRANAMPETVRTNYGGPLAPAVALLRDLTRWHAALPAHLCTDAVRYAPPGIQRAILLLHIQYHYTVCLVARHALLSRYTSLQKGGPRSDSLFGHEGSMPSDSVTELALSRPCSATSIADACQDSGRVAVVLLLQLAELGQFNARTGLDVYYLYSATLVLVLSLICDTAQRKVSAASETRSLFQKSADLARKHRDERQTPGTMRRWLGIIGDLYGGVASKSSGSVQPQTTSSAKASRDSGSKRNSCVVQQPSDDPVLPRVQMQHHTTNASASRLERGSLRPDVAAVPNTLLPGPYGGSHDFIPPAPEVQPAAATLASELELDVAAFSEGRMDMYDGRADFINPPAIPPLVLEFFNTNNTSNAIESTFGTGTADWSFDYYISGMSADSQNVLW
ncbi:hypothetical protein HMPREF1624_08749 [Sporothrix schenckii ATCC 58251]|uniref:Zn(2)-C6 fungal-type domain-containing protein n=1 Tax=Sporothrix schenckii (strain ATCC 58251 / de Perez 2211183) TaxID=1391915 RepID=U7PH47_SPOS1|nr:hypothetical protein HMPREF1624_08749 [Sporothrix schenckii ATCC 58251]